MPGFYDHVKIPVMLACNDDNGNFDGKMRIVEVHDCLYLEHEGFLEDEGLAFALGDDHGVPSLVIGGCKFQYISRREWVGNICWDLFWMYGKAVQELLNYLVKTGQFTCTQGESRLYNWWEKGETFGDSEMGIIAKYSSTFRL
jgi:hypothetical protein